MVMDFRDNVQKCQEYIHALEEEKLKIQVFQRELPLCLELVTQAIETCKQQLSGIGHFECSEQTTSNGPILEEFIPLKRSNSSDDYEEEEHESDKNHSSHDNDDDDEDEDGDEDDNHSEKSGEKSDWLRSVQLWSQTPDLLTTHDLEHQPKVVSVVEVKRNGAFHPFQKEKTKITLAPAASACSSAEEDGSGGGGGGGGGKKEEKGEQAQRKARRCWSPELHRRFLNALQNLGGSHVATPKQIRDLMKVDGLTNDEVKSHLQKYRLHTRRPTPSIHTNNTTQTPQFVVMGGIWVPAATNGVYAPVAGVAGPPCTVAAQQGMKKQCSQSHSTGARRSSSPATSSSTHTTTASHAY